MDNPVIESPKIEDEGKTVKPENDVETEVVAGSTSIEAPPTIDYEAKKLARDAKAKRKDEKTVQQVLKSLDSLKSPQDKLSAMCKKYSDLLHENRQLQATVKQSEKNINMIHREKEQFRHERSKAVLAKMRLEQLCRELQKLNKAQLEETALKLRVEEEKRKEICFTFQSAFAEMNTLTNQNNEKSAKMREENLEMRENIKSVREGIELTEAQLDKVRQQSRLELELAEKKYLRNTLELTAEKEALKQDKKQLLLKLAEYHVRIKEHEVREQYLTKQIMNSQEKFEELKRDFETTFEFSKTFRPESKEMKKKMLKLEKETALWKQRWEKTNAAILQMAEIKDKRDAEIITLSNKLSTLQELCKVFQRERASLIAQLREKNEGAQVDRKALADENRKAMKQFEIISKDCEKLRDNLPKLEGSFSEVMREAFRATSHDEDSNDSAKGNKKMSKKLKNEARKKSNQKKEESSTTNEVQEGKSVDSEKPESPPENGANGREPSDLESAILDRNESVFKDIEKVLAEQAELQAKIASVQEMEKAIASGNGLNTEVHQDNEVTELSEVAPEELVPLRDSAFDDEPEVLQITEILENTETSSNDDDKVKDSGKESKALETGGCELDAATCKLAKSQLNGKPEITDKKIIEESTNNIIPPCADSKLMEIEPESEKTELSITEIQPKNEQSPIKKPEAEKIVDSNPEDVKSISNSQEVLSPIKVPETTINSSNNSILEVRENVIET